MENETAQKPNPLLASDMVKYLRMRAEAERFRKQRPALDSLLGRLLDEDHVRAELARLDWDIPTL